eukprot:s3787_g2.t1
MLVPTGMTGRHALTPIGFDFASRLDASDPADHKKQTPGYSSGCLSVQRPEDLDKHAQRVGGYAMLLDSAIVHCRGKPTSKRPRKQGRSSWALRCLSLAFPLWSPMTLPSFSTASSSSSSCSSGSCCVRHLAFFDTNGTAQQLRSIAAVKGVNAVWMTAWSALR